MKHAYLIMAHNEETLLEMLIRSLDYENHDLYIHLDKKWNVEESRFQTVAKNARVFFLPRMSIRWGGSELIDLELRMLEESTKEYHDYYHFLSGVDLPVKKHDEIERFFCEHKGEEFISFDEVACRNREFEKRYDDIHFFVPVTGNSRLVRGGKKYWNRLLRLLLKIPNRILGKRSKRYPELTFMKGSEWVDITHSFAEYVVENASWMRNFYRYATCCDEVFLQTLAWNSSFREKINWKKPVRYIDWSKHGSSPELLDESYYDRIMNSGALFARKFSYEKHPEICERIMRAITE
ncbi:MAG: beta-1,6-N-acetylglucosaminyltransferase [Butyricicoccaceae bacterium]